MRRGQRTTQTLALMAVLALASFSALLVVPEEAAASSHYNPRAPIYINGNSDFTASNGVTGGSGTAEDPYIIEGWEIDSSQAHGIEIRNTDALFIVRDVYVHSGTNDGIFLDNVVNGRVENATILDNRRGIELWFSANITITGSNVSSNNNWAGIYSKYADNVTIAGNDIYSNEGYGIDFWSSANITVTDNNVSWNEWVGITLDRCSNATVAGNSVANNGGGIQLGESTNVTVTGNDLTANGVDINGPLISHYSSNTVTPDNLVNGKPLYYYKDCSGVEVDGVPVGQLIVANCTDVRVSNLDIANTDTGIRMAFVYDLVIIGNEISGNNLDGIILRFSGNAIITGNVVSWSGRWGISLILSTNIAVHHNSLIFNDVQAYDYAGSENSWHDGYPSGGNYWSDYEGEDNCSGTGQDVCPDPDGIGDTPHALDKYPLMEPQSPTNVSPLASFVVEPTRGNVTATFRADASGSFDFEDLREALEVRWDWEDNGEWDTPWSTTKTAEHQYAEPGTYTIRLEVSDTDGRTDQATKLVGVWNAQPKASFDVVPLSGNVTTAFSVDASASSDLEDPVTALEVRWDWGDDGTWDTGWTTEKIAEHQYAEPGTYTIRLEVRDTGGLAGSTARQVEVAAAPGDQGEESDQGEEASLPLSPALVAFVLLVAVPVAVLLFLFRRRRKIAAFKKPDEET